MTYFQYVFIYLFVYMDFLLQKFFSHDPKFFTLCLVPSIMT